MCKGDVKAFGLYMPTMKEKEIPARGNATLELFPLLDSKKSGIGETAELVSKKDKREDTYFGVWVDFEELAQVFHKEEAEKLGVFISPETTVAKAVPKGRQPTAKRLKKEEELKRQGVSEQNSKNAKQPRKMKRKFLADFEKNPTKWDNKDKISYDRVIRDLTELYDIDRKTANGWYKEHIRPRREKNILITPKSEKKRVISAKPQKS